MTVRVISDDEVLASMPELARQMVAVIGLSDTMKLCERLGGLRLRFSDRQARSSHARLLAETLGTGPALKLAGLFGIEAIACPG